MTLTEGTKPGRYEIRSVIGVGGMGEVYRASDPKIGLVLAHRHHVTGDGQRFLVNAPAETTGRAPFKVILN